MIHHQRFTISYKKYFYALLLTCSLDLHSPKSTLSKNSQEKLQENKNEASEKKRRHSFVDFLQRKVSETSQKSLLSKNKISQQQKLKEFCKKYSFPENLEPQDVLYKSWTDLLSEIYDLSKELLVDIGFYTPKKGEDIENTPYLEMVKKGIQTLKSKNEKNEKDIFFFLAEEEFFMPSLKPITLTNHKSRCDKLNENLIKFQKNYKFTDGFNDFSSFLTSYCNYQISRDFIKFNNFPSFFQILPIGRENVIKTVLEKNEFYTLYIKNIYEKILGLLFDNVDLFNDFFSIINSGNFNKEKVSRLKKAIDNLIPLEDSSAFALCALSFVAHPYSYNQNNYTDFNIYFHMFCPSFFLPEEFKENISSVPLDELKQDIPLLCLLEHFNHRQDKFYKFLSFKNKVNFQDCSIFSFQSFEKVNFSKGISFRKKKLIPTAQCPNNPFFKKALNLQNYRRSLWLFIENYFKPKYHTLEMSLLKRLTILGLVVFNGDQEDYDQYMDNINCTFSEKYSNFFPKIARLYYSYDYDHTFSHLAMNNNEKNFLESLQDLTKKLVDYAKNMNIAQQNFSSPLYVYNYHQHNQFRTYSAKLLLSINLKKTKKEDILDNFLKVTSIALLPYNDDYFMQNAYNKDPFTSLLTITKRKLKIFPKLKKFYFQQVQKIIKEDLTMMQLLRSFLKKKNITKKNGQIIQVFNKMNNLNIELFPYCSNYSFFYTLIQSLESEKSTILEKLENDSHLTYIYLENINYSVMKNFITKKLVSFYYATYRDFFIFQGIMDHSSISEKLNMYYKDPLVVALTIICENSLTPCLMDIGYMNNMIDFIS